jgi:hypothetical protein
MAGSRMSIITATLAFAAALTVQAARAEAIAQDCAAREGSIDQAFDREGTCCRREQIDQCGLCFGENDCADCANVPWGPRVQDNHGVCCPPAQLDQQGLCLPENPARGGWLFSRSGDLAALTRES